MEAGKITKKISKKALGSCQKKKEKQMALGSYTYCICRYHYKKSALIISSTTEEDLLIAERCEFNPPASASSSSHRFVLLDSCELDNDTVKNLSSNFPCMEWLTLVDCTWTGALNIHVVNPTLKTLKVHICCLCYRDCEITIYAPNLLHLSLEGVLPNSNYQIKDLSSVVAACFSFYRMPFEIEEADAAADRLNELLLHFRHAACLDLCSWCVKVLDIKEMQGLSNLPCVRELKLEIGFKKWELPGIAYLLKSCANLQGLKIRVDHFRAQRLNIDLLCESNFNESEFWDTQELHSSSIIEHLKTVEIIGFMHLPYHVSGDGVVLFGDTAGDKKSLILEDLFEWAKIEIEFVRFLLKKSPAMEKMTIKLPKGNGFNQRPEVLKVVEKLLGFPRVSRKAEINIF